MVPLRLRPPPTRPSRSFTSKLSSRPLLGPKPHLADHARVPPPPLAHFHKRAEKPLRPQNLLDRAAGGRPPRLEQGPAPADHDRLLALALHEHGGLDAHEA